METKIAKTADLIIWLASSLVLLLIANSWLGLWQRIAETLTNAIR